MKELEKLFAQKLTENGDNAYNTTGSTLTDILFMSQYYRNHLNKVPMIADEPRALTFAMFIRDPRYGLGERDLGRELLRQIMNNVYFILSSHIDDEEKLVEKADALDELINKIIQCGRYDDLLYMEDILAFQRLLEDAENGNELAKKWLPRLTSGKKSREQALAIINLFGISERQYRKICKVETTESKLCEHKEHEIEYEKVPSLALLKYWQAFNRKDSARFNRYLMDVKSGKKKMNTSVTNCYDVYKQYDNRNTECDLLFNQLPKVNLGSILPIVDHSGSMFDNFDSAGKAMAIGHYVAKNSTYMNNHIITFSSSPELLKLGNNYDEDMEILDSYDDCSNTDFGKVMNLLSGLKEDFPDYLLVLSDMQFDIGSNQSKAECMRIFKEKGAKTKIIWWNLCTRSKTSPELEQDNYGNIFLSGYNPMLLSLLEVGFNQNQYLNKLLDEYEAKINKGENK